MIIPILVSEKQILHWVWLDVDSNVDQVTERVKHAKDKYENSNQLVKVDVVVEGEISCQPVLPE